MRIADWDADCGVGCGLRIAEPSLTRMSFYRHPGLRRAELVKPTGNAASQMRPDVLPGRSVSINMQPLTGLGTCSVSIHMQPLTGWQRVACL